MSEIPTLKYMLNFNNMQIFVEIFLKFFKGLGSNIYRYTKNGGKFYLWGYYLLSLDKYHRALAKTLIDNPNILSGKGDINVTIDFGIMKRQSIDD